MFNPSTTAIKGTIFKEIVSGGFNHQRLATIRWLFVWGKGTRSKENFGEPIPRIETFNTFLHF